MRHYHPIEPGTRSGKLHRLFAIQRQVWRQTGLADAEPEVPLSAASLAAICDAARASLIRPQDP